MGDDGGGLPVPMPGADVVQGRRQASVKRLNRLRTRNGEPIGIEAQVQAALTAQGLDLGPGEAVQQAIVILTQPGVIDDRQVQSGGQDVGGFSGAADDFDDDIPF